MSDVRYVIKFKNDGFYAGHDYIVQGLKNAIVDMFGAKGYKTERMANKVMNRIISQCENVGKNEVCVMTAKAIFDENGKEESLVVGNMKLDAYA